MNNKNRKTKSLLINPQFQWTIIAYAASVAGLILATVYGFFNYGVHSLLKTGIEAGLANDHLYFQMIRSFDGSFRNIFWILVISVAVILVTGGLIVSHKIAGPIRRMQNEFLTMSHAEQAQFRKINFRKGDFFPELADSYNEVVEKNQVKHPN